MKQFLITPLLSHQASDKKFLSRVAEGLIQKGLKPIMNIWEFIPGDSLLESMNIGIQSSTSLVLFWSKHSAKSEYVKIERELGLQALKANMRHLYEKELAKNLLHKPI